MIHVRIICDYPADPEITGWPAETVDLTLTLPGSFAASATEAHAKINALIEAGGFFEIPAADDATPFEFAPELIRDVVVWEG